jgi:hypothetical protein
MRQVSRAHTSRSRPDASRHEPLLVVRLRGEAEKGGTEGQCTTPSITPRFVGPQLSTGLGSQSGARALTTRISAADTLVGTATHNDELLGLVYAEELVKK